MPTQVESRYIRLLKPFVKRVLNLMEVNFDTDDFVREFKLCCPDKWDELKRVFKYYDSYRDHHDMNDLSAFPAPKIFLMSNYPTLIDEVRKRKNELSKQDKEKIRTSLIEESKRRTEAFEKGRMGVQGVEPQYLHELSERYFRTGNINERIDIVKHFFNYDSQFSNNFLKNVYRLEKDYLIRLVIFYVLHSRREIFFMNRREFERQDKYYGLNKKYGTVEDLIHRNPSELLKDILNYASEQSIEFDLFISYSSIDKDVVEKIVKKLNKQGLSVYADMLNDRNDLPREKLCADTANVIRERLKKVKALLYIHTANSIKSLWTPWEIGYFDALSKPICYIKVSEEVLPPYIETYNEVLEKDGSFVVDVVNNAIPLKKWIGN